MRFQPRLSSAFWLIALLATVVAIGACRQGGPIPDPTPRTPQADATISGTVRGVQGTTPVAGRLVHAVNVGTGAVMRGITNEAGGYTFKVPPGRYRVEVTLVAGESIVEQPNVLDVSPAALELSADFILGTTRLSRPRIRYRTEHGLGAPSA